MNQTDSPYCKVHFSGTKKLKQRKINFVRLLVEEPRPIQPSDLFDNSDNKRVPPHFDLENKLASPCYYNQTCKIQPCFPLTAYQEATVSVKT